MGNWFADDIKEKVLAENFAERADQMSNIFIGTNGAEEQKDFSCWGNAERLRSIAGVRGILVATVAVRNDGGRDIVKRVETLNRER